MYYNINILYVQYFHSFIHSYTHQMGAILDIVSNQSLFQTTTAYSILLLFLQFSEKFQNLTPLQPIPVKILKECSKRCVIQHSLIQTGINVYTALYFYIQQIHKSQNLFQKVGDKCKQRYLCIFIENIPILEQILSRLWIDNI